MSVRKPTWWLLYALVPIMIGLLIVDHDLVLSLLGHELVQIGILVVVFVLMALWVRANEKSILLESTRESMEKGSRIVVYEPAESGRPVTPEGPSPRVLASTQVGASAYRTNSYVEGNNFRTAQTVAKRNH